MAWTFPLHTPVFPAWCRDKVVLGNSRLANDQTPSKPGKMWATELLLQDLGGGITGLSAINQPAATPPY